MNNITYVGNVTIKVKDKPPVKKNNNGTATFFNVLRDIMILAKQPNTDDLPYYMAVVKDPPLSNESVSSFFNKNTYNNLDNDLKMLLRPLLITSRVATNNTENNGGNNPFKDGSCVLSVLLPHSETLLPEPGSAPDVVYILLLNARKDKQILAYSQQAYKDIAPVFQEVNGQAGIEWELTFGNSKEMKN